MNGDLNNYKNQVFRGSSQRERGGKALMPSNIRIDARTLHDWIVFVAKTAELIRFYNTDDNVVGTWAELLEKDSSFFLASIMTTRSQDWDEKAGNLIRQFYAGVGTNKQEACRDLVEHVVQLAELLNKWYKSSETIITAEQRLEAEVALEKAIRSELCVRLTELKQIIQFLQKDQKPALTEAYDARWGKFHPDWTSVEPADKQPLVLSSTEDAVEQLRLIFQRLQFTLVLMTEKSANWFQASLEKQDDHTPHVALLLAFLQLFRYAQEQMNALATEHLNHYFFDILLQQQQPHVPERATVQFELADHIDTFLLKAGIPLLAGINQDGLESCYATMDDLLLTKARIASLSTLFISRNGLAIIGSSYKLVTGIYSAPVANSRDGFGTPFPIPDQGWPVFGEEQWEKNVGDRNMRDAQIGFAIASPVLNLQEGDRKINLSFQVTNESFAIFSDLLDDICSNTGKTRKEEISRLFDNALEIYASGESGWFKIDRWHLKLPEQFQEEAALDLTLFLSLNEPSIVAYKPYPDDTDLHTDVPVIKVLLHSGDNNYVYSFLYSLELLALNIEVQVKNLKSLVLMNELGRIDPSGPFMPFGPTPSRNAYLLVGSAELFQKRLSNLAINIEWHNLPDDQGGFAEYFQAYPNGIDNNSFEIRLSGLNNYSFKPVDIQKQQTFKLFQSESATGKIHPETKIDAIKLDVMDIQPDYSLNKLPDFTQRLKNGYFKIQLHNPSMAFGHQDYPRLFSTALMAQTQSGGFLNVGASNKPEILIPNLPFAPSINRLSVDYTATSTLNMRPLESDENDLNAREKIISLLPFGQNSIFSEGKTVTRFLLPRLDEDGFLYIGIESASPGNPINLFFEIRESKSNTTANFLDVKWSFLNGSDWELFTHENLLSDSTYQFTTSGIVRILLPVEIKTDHSIMPPGLFWIRAAANGNTKVAGTVLNTASHAVEAVWMDNGDASHFNQGAVLPPIKQLKTERSEIKSVKQVRDFYGGSPAENLEHFYIRVSERLRHKNRGITRWDIEHLVLQEFPQVRRVKCVGCEESPKVKPGSLRVAVVANTINGDIQPMLGLHQLEVIREFLEGKISPFVAIKVVNPAYERIRVNCAIRLKKEFTAEKGVYLQQLHQDILDFICPWVKFAPIPLGGSVSKNELLRYIHERPYIDDVTGFSLVQIFEESTDLFQITDTAVGLNANEVLQASTPWSLLIPADRHNITFLEKGEYALPTAAAIEGMRVGTDFIVLEGAETTVDKPATPDIPEDSNTDWYLISKPN